MAGCGAILAVEDEKMRLGFNETDAVKSGTKPGSRETQLADRNAKIIFSEYLGLSENNRQTFAVNIDRGKGVGYRKGFRYNLYESTDGETLAQSQRFTLGHQKIGKIRINQTEKTCRKAS